MSTGTRSQECFPLFGRENIADKLQAVGAGATLTLPVPNPLLPTAGMFHVAGYSQLTGTIRSDQAGDFVIEGSVLAGGGGATWNELYRVNPMVINQLYQFVIDCTFDYIRMRYVDPGGGSNVEVDAKLWPVSALESNRAASAPDVVDLETKETTHHAAANAVANGTDAALDGSFAYSRFQIITTAGIIAATLQFFGSENGANFVAINARNTVTGVVANNSVVAGSANEVWEADVAGLRVF
ncbi:hypothetical protein KKE60_09060, partial [Patescibacteria group bacterium]|nr:hypothetical protein [Patescibacteria group bacterium]